MVADGKDRRFCEIVKRYGVSDAALEDAREYVDKHPEVVLSRVLVSLGSISQDMANMAIAHHKVVNARPEDADQVSRAIDEAISHTKSVSEELTEQAAGIVNLLSLA